MIAGFVRLGRRRHLNEWQPRGESLLPQPDRNLPSIDVVFIRRRLSLALTAVALLVVGCAKSKVHDSKYAEVGGIVLVDGVPLSGGTITFIPVIPYEDGGRPGIGRIEPNGRYKLGNANPERPIGATPGEYRVTILQLELVADQSGRLSPKTITPDRYAEWKETELRAKVEAGVNVIDFRLTRRPADSQVESASKSSSGDLDQPAEARRSEKLSK